MTTQDHLVKSISKFKRRFKQSYGQTAISRFKKIIQNPSSKLSDTANHFGFSRANASLVYQKIYGSRFCEAKHTRALAKKFRELQENPRYKLAKQVSGILKQYDLEPEIKVESRRSIVLICNGFRIKPKRPSQTRVGPYNYFRLDLDLESDFTFLALPNSDSYIIPSKILNLSQNRISIPTLDRESKYHQFRNAWNLLRK